MHIHLIAVGDRMPAWVEAGYGEYAKRLPRECALRLVEIAPGRRGRNADVARIVRDEGERMLAAIPRDCHVIALEVGGGSWSTPQLAVQLEGWMHSGRDVALLVGGPEGLDDACRARADQLWSLSALTLPHPLVRIVLAEALYRAWSVMAGHPYHRG
ncbi:MAG: 23S rRNA (pseudouridine(1915)-N(3))-methyltransferase RlmH [Gammaproteobacteria bacterium]|nr:23S rRNA (pseudouridine(1915)-N(3))-methyltransferase RlmH [Gammaproteobacteria bacterium]